MTYSSPDEIGRALGETSAAVRHAIQVLDIRRRKHHGRLLYTQPDVRAIRDWLKGNRPTR